MPQSEALAQAGAMGRKPAFDVFRAFLKLGFTSFGGPIAHLGYFRAEFVERRKGMSDRAFALSQGGLAGYLLTVRENAHAARMED